MTKFFLYLFLAGQCPIQVPGSYATLDDCNAAGQVEMSRWKIIHHRTSGYAWCIGGRE